MRSPEEQKSKMCPYCGENNVRCKDSRAASDPAVMTRRIYVCLSCEQRFTTHEVIAALHEGAVDVGRARIEAFTNGVETLFREIFGAEDGTLIRKPRSNAMLKGIPPSVAKRVEARLK